LRRKEAELNATLSSMIVWKNEANSWLRQAVDFGLLPSGLVLPEAWPDVLDLLRRLANTTSRSASLTLKSIEVPLARLEELRGKETEASDRVSELRQRLNEIRRLLQSSSDFGSAIRVQRDRLSISKWIRDKTSMTEDVIGTLSMAGRQNVNTLVDALDGLELQLRSHPSISDRLEREQLRLRGEAEKSLDDLAEVRKELVLLERDSEKARDAAYGFDRVERYIGSLQQALTIYDRADGNTELRSEISDLKANIEVLRSKVSEHEILRRTANATASVESTAASIVPNMDVEYPNAAIKLVITELTLKIVRGTRDDFLWEIGSGANWLAYHIAISLSLQRFFLELPHHPVPALLVYDQPSQVYFPRRVSKENETVQGELRDEDIVAVRKVFMTLASEVNRTSARLQIIVLDHAGSEVWGEIEGVTLTEEWRDGHQKLVPIEWLSA
jgi:hypothetical protein